MPGGVTSRMLRRWLEDHGPALALYAAQWTASADDCVQEALVEAAALPRAPDRPEAWLFRRVRQRALNAARGERRRRDTEAAAWRERLAARDRSADPTESRELLDLLETLPPDDCEVVLLRFWSDLTYAEIATVTGASSSAVHRRMTAALNHLREHWDTP